MKISLFLNFQCSQKGCGTSSSQVTGNKASVEFFFNRRFARLTTSSGTVPVTLFMASFFSRRRTPENTHKSLIHIRIEIGKKKLNALLQTEWKKGKKKTLGQNPHKIF